jgi:transposase-like protein
LSRISIERKEAILKKLLLPHLMSVAEVSKEEGISRATLYYWRQQLSQYCRAKGLYLEQIKNWKNECMQGFKSSKEQEAKAKKQAKEDKLEIKELKKELRYKEKALAETAALSKVWSPRVLLCTYK